MAAQISINQLPPAGAITGAELVPVVQNGQTVQTTTGAISGSPSQTQSFLTVNQEPTLVNSRYLAVSTGLGLTNGGAGSFLRISLNGASGSLEAAGNGLVVKDSSSSVVARQIAVNGAGLSITDPSGVAGNPTLALSGLAAAFANLGGSGLAYVNAGTTAGLRLLTGTSNQITVTDGNGVAGNPTFALASNPVIPGTGAMTIPIGTSAQQPGGSDGQFRFNSDTGTFDGYAAGSWRTFSLSGGVTTFSAGSTGLTPAVPTSGSVTLAGTLNTSNGGTGLGGASPFTQYGILYASSANALTTGTALTFDGTNLGVGNSAFAWDTAAFNNAIDLSVYGAIYSTSSVAGVTGNVYYDGSAWHIKTLGPSTRYDQTAGSHVFYAAPTPVGLGNTTPTFVEILRLNTTGITLDGGTANGVLYLNGSKVATSGSEFSYNGAVFQVGTGAATRIVDAVGASNSVSYRLRNWDAIGCDAGSGLTIGGLTGSQWTNTQFFASGSEQMRLTSTGLGIGTSSPSYKLDVRVAPASGGAAGAGVTTGSYEGTILITGSAYNNYGVGANTAWLYSATNDVAIGPYGGSGTVQIVTGGARRATFDSSGNLGLGVTPSAWNTFRAMQIGAGASVFGHQTTVAEAYLSANSYFSSGNKYIGSGAATLYSQSAGSHSWSTAPSGTAGNTITFTQAMTLDSSGNLGIGTSSPAQKLHVRQDQAAYTWGRVDNQSSSASAYAGWMLGAFGNSWGIAIGSSAANGNALSFVLDAGGGNAEKMRLDSSGNLGLGVTPSAWGSAWKAMQISTFASFGGNNDDKLTAIGNNYYNDGSAKYIGTGQAALYSQYQGAHRWATAPSGTAGNAITFTQAMTLDSSGNLGIGTSSPGSKLDVTTSGQDQQLRLVSTGNVVFRTRWVDATTGMALESNNSTETAYYPLSLTGSTLRIGTGDGSLKATLDSSGNLGLGVTPSANDYTGAMQFKWIGHSVTPRTVDNFALTMNAYHSGGGWKYGNSATASAYIQSGGQHLWYTAPSGTAGNAITFTQAMTLDASGNLGVGTTSPVSRLAVAESNTDNVTVGVWNTSSYGSGNQWSRIQLGKIENVTYQPMAEIIARPDTNASSTSGSLLFYTRASGSTGERARITSGGDFLIGGFTAESKLNVYSGGGTFSSGTMPAGMTIYGNTNDGQGSMLSFKATSGDQGIAGIAGVRSSGYETELRFYTNNTNSQNAFTERARITSGGDLLVGVTTPGYDAANRGLIEVNGTSTALFGLRVSAVNKGYLYHDSTNMYLSNDANGFLSFYTNATERARITSGGALLVGATSVSGSETLRVYNSTNSRVTIDQASNGLILGADSSGPFLDTSGSNRLAFFIAGTERARITSGGYFKASNDGTYDGSTSSYHELRNTANTNTVVVSATNASYTSDVINITTTRGANQGFNFINALANGNGQFQVRGDGTIFAQNTTVQSLSDVRTKENIVNALDGLNVILALRPVRFDFKQGFGNDRKNQLGFIAQEVETVFPDAVDKSSDTTADGDFLKTMGSAALIPVLVKAIQEQQALIQSLTARVALLEGN